MVGGDGRSCRELAVAAGGHTDATDRGRNGLPVTGGKSDLAVTPAIVPAVI